ncbi:hypothetical protein VTP01DRAFT_2277 [Rhizomucor pusillus]|uniref:uncharacterized protein n=1 Tax=Rhizomucor pusillus TaxID=4840 RepID=UPI0037425BC4
MLCVPPFLSSRTFCQKIPVHHHQGTTAAAPTTRVELSKGPAMITDYQLSLIANALGVTTMLLIVAYHYISVNTDTKSPAHPVVDSRYSRLSFQSADSKKSYKYRVSFDNVSNIAAKPLISYTLRTASEGYQTSSSPVGRLFMLIIDDHSCDEEIENVIRYVADLVDNGDEVVLVGMYLSYQTLDYCHPKQLATSLLKRILNAQHDDKISVTVELAFGKPEHALKTMVQMYEPTMLIIGCRKKRISIFSTSLTTLIQNSLKNLTIPVIFVQQYQCASPTTIAEEQRSDDDDDPGFRSPPSSSCKNPNATAADDDNTCRGGHRRSLTVSSSPLPDLSHHHAELRKATTHHQRSFSNSSASNIIPTNRIFAKNLGFQQIRRRFTLLKK